MLNPVVSSRIDSIIVDPSDKVAIQAISEESLRKKKLTVAVSKKVAYAALGVKRMTSPRWKRILAHGEQAGAFRVDGTLVLPAVPDDLGDGVHVLSRPGVAFMGRVPVVATEELGYYDGDPGLRLTALEGQECFSSHDDTDTECKSCPLRGFCAAATNARIEAVALRLDGEVEAALADAARTIAQEQEQEELMAARGSLHHATQVAIEGEGGAVPDPMMVSGDENPTPEQVASLLGGELIERAPFEAVCFGCSKPIAEGTSTVVVRGRGAAHVECARAALKEAS